MSSQLPKSTNSVSVNSSYSKLHLTMSSEETSAGSIPVQMTSSSSVVPHQVSGTGSSVPIQLTQNSGLPIQLSTPVSDFGSIKLSRSNLQMQASLPVLFHVPGTAVPSQSNQSDLNSERIGDNRSNGSSVNLLQDPNATHVKIQGGNVVQVNNQGPVQMQMNNSEGSHLPNHNSLQFQGSSKPPIVYIQTPTGLKPATQTMSSSIASFSLRKPVTAMSNVQFLATKTAIITKSSTTSCSTASSKVLQTSKVSSSIPPISIAPSTVGKHAFTSYFSTVKKPMSVGKIQDTNLIVPPSHLIIPTTNNQKVLLNSMNVSKINNSKVLPGSVTNKAPIINVQISNGQIQSDGKLTIMQQNSLLGSDVPPLQPLSTKNIPISGANVIIPSVTSNLTNSTVTDKNFSSTIPTGSRVELIGEQEYALSIPETNASNEDLYSVTLSDDSNQQTPADSKSYSIAFDDKERNSQSVLMNKSENESVQIIKKNFESENSEKKIININTENGEDKAHKDSSKSLSHALSLICKNKVIEVSEENPLPSLFCSEKIGVEAVNSNSILRNKDVCEDIVKNNVIPKIVQKPLTINKDRRKSRISGDIYQNITIKKELSIKPYRFDDNIFDEDSLGLQWRNKVAMLKGSNLQFKTNEFGIIDVVESDDEDYTPRFSTPLQRRSEQNGREKKPTSPEDLYCCETCGCHGMAAEFVSPSFCSASCERTDKNRLKKFKELEIKKKRKHKKILLQKPIKPREDENYLNDLQKCNSKFSESYPEITITKMKNDNKVKNKYPWINDQGVFSWYHWLDYCKAKPAPAKLFKDSSNAVKNGFRIGMKLEAIDPAHPSLYAVVTVSEIQGFRLKLHFDGFHEDFDFWVNADSCDIFPAGWCEKNGRVLRPPVGFTQNSFNWPLYLKQVKAVAAPKILFSHVSSTNICPNGFRIGMKLEAEDKKNSLMCVATVTDVVDNRILIHFDSWDDIYDYWVDPTSPYIHPVGWCDENGISLTPPNFYKDPESFTWEQYLSDTSSAAVPPRAFKPRAPHNFKVGMKLEAVDKRVPFLIRCATVSEVRPNQIRISFDGWPDELSYWVDDDCADIHEVGWCLKTGHPLEPPLTPDDFAIPGECGTGGCRGLGNSFAAKRTTHSIAEECPYKLPASSPVTKDRLAGVRPPPLHTEPKTKEPRKLLAAHSKDKKRDEVKMEIVLSDDEGSNDSKSRRKRKASPGIQDLTSRKISKEPLTSIVYEPGYLPNPNWVTPPVWRINSLRIEEILQKQGLRMDPRNWSQADVHDFIERLVDCKNISKQFVRHRIDGESFLMLSQDDLINIFRMRLGPALKVYNSILQLRQKILS